MENKELKANNQILWVQNKLNKKLNAHLTFNSTWVQNTG